MKRAWVLAIATVILSLTMVHPVFAILGIGDIVFDPSVFGQTVEQVLQLKQQTMQLVQSYQMLRNQYDHCIRMAKQVPMDMTARYHAAMTPWRNSSAANTYGTTGGWTAGITTGLDAAEGY